MATFKTFNPEEHTEQEFIETRFFYLMDYSTEEFHNGGRAYELDIIELTYDPCEGIWWSYDIHCVACDGNDVIRFSRDQAAGAVDHLAPADPIKVYLTKEKDPILPVWDFIEDIEALEDENE